MAEIEVLENLRPLLIPLVSALIAYLVARGVARSAVGVEFARTQVSDIYPPVMERLTRMQEQLTRHPFPSVLFRPMSGHHEDASETLSFRWWTELKAAGRDRLIHKPIRQKLHRLEDAAISYWDLWEPARDVVFADLKPRYAARLGHIPAVCMNAAMRVMSTHDIPDDAETQFEIDAEELKQCRDNVGDSAEVNALRTHRQVLKALIDETLDDIREHIDKLATRLERG